jgi:ubiquinone/menaquinone biosynthesis C-methylase UbiE
MVSARALAADRGTANLRFAVADACVLPFRDASFDAVFSHALLQHVGSPLDAVREMKRVLRPGGVIGIADADFGGSLSYPSSHGIDRGGEVWQQMRPSPFVGRELCSLLASAGFSRIEGWFTGGGPANQNTAAANGQFWAAYFEAEPFIVQAAAMGWATREEMLEIAAAWREWAKTPGAYWAAFWCQALGWAPETA